MTQQLKGYRVDIRAITDGYWVRGLRLNAASVAQAKDRIERANPGFTVRRVKEERLYDTEKLR